MRKVFFSILCALPALAFSAVPVTQNGKPAAQIVLTSDAGESGSLAAKELQHWIKEISGAALPIVNKADTSKSRIVLKRDPSLKLKADGYVISEPVKGKEIVIAAPKSRGILSGAWKLLFINTDIIWARPNAEYGTIFSQKKTLVFDKTSFKYNPVFVLRGFQYTGYFVEEEMWQARNGNNWSTNMVRGGKFLKDLYDSGFIYVGYHNLVRIYFPEKKYWETHPEYYALINGRRADPSLKANKTNLCYTNKECQAEFLKTFQEIVKKNLQYDMIGVCQEDNLDVCSCPECVKPIKLDNGKELTVKDKNFQSTRFFLWLIPAAEWLQKNYPGKKIKTNAYFLTEPAPGCKLPKNLSVSFAPIYKDGRYPIIHPVNKASLAKFHSWTSTGAELRWREYYGLCGEFPRPADAVMAEDLKYAYSKYGINDTMSEMRHDREFGSWHGHFVWDQNSMYFYVMAHLHEDPFRPVEELRNEFLTRVYGEAAPYVKEYYALTEKAWLKLKAKSQWDDRAQAKWNAILAADPTLQQKLSDRLAKAKKCRMHPNGRKILERLIASFEKMSHPKKTYFYARKAKGKVEFTDPLFTQGAWKGIPAEEYFLKDGRWPNVKIHTAMKLLYDNTNLYVAVRCTDKNGENVYAAKAGSYRDKWVTGNKMELFIVTADKKRMWLVWDSNGNIMDVMGKHPGWDFFKDLPIRKDKDGWSTLVTIPFSVIGYDPEKNPEFPFYCVRYYYDHITKDRSTTPHLVNVPPWETTVFPVLKLAKDGEKIPMPVKPLVAVPKHWYHEKATPAEVGKTANGEVFFRCTMKTTNDRRIFWQRSPIGKIKAGVKYRITVKARSEKPLEVTLKAEGSAPWQAVAKTIKLTPEWKDYTLTFTMKPFKKTPYFLFWVRTPGTAEFIPVKLEECADPSGNLVQNSTFEDMDGNGLPANWDLRNKLKAERVTLPDGKYAMKLSGKGNGLFFIQWSLQLKPQTDYELSARIKGKKGTTLRVYAECNKPWNQYGEKIACTGDWQEIRVPVKFAKIVNSPYFVFSLGSGGEAIVAEPKIMLKTGNKSK